MIKLSRVLLASTICLASTLCSLTWGIDPADAQDTVDPWQKKKQEIFKPLSDAAQQTIGRAVPATPTAKPRATRKILVFYRCEGFVHGSIPYANQAIKAMAEKTGAFQADFADTYDVFTNENLANYDLVLLNNTTGMQFQEPSQQNALLDFIADGNGLAGIHAASDNFGDFPRCRALIGGQFSGHPWGAGGTWAFKLDDPEHVLNDAFDGQGFWHSDEIYQYQPESYQGPEVLRLLVSLDMNQEEVSKRIDDGPREVPVSWIRQAGDGRIFYTNFGHRNETFQNPAMLRHMLDGIQYAIGDLDADATPTAKADEIQPALAPAK
ncbi:ThuA domain-containing protein [Allorhodopirellula solitaria]|uniref:Trehalose utilization n=1 Tax=Allorhodopirellula solitaria TaxID=2527987 RepID=A0A5C5WWY9_9BACT|nr:ThuA domain-containing protein [Allorhodopirellula solitaria]TWT55227.1 Trehalose utilization [Allorhodopirellula solitaria]